MNRLPACALLLATPLALAPSAAVATEPVPAATAPAAASAAPPAGGAPRGLPRWEWGLGIAGAWVRDYPGSEHYSTYGLPYPWFTWRSDRVLLGHEGGRGVLWRRPALAVDAVLSANPPSSTGDNPERAGMPDLHALLEPGLRLRWQAWSSADGRWRLNVRLPWRAALAIYDGGLHNVGSRIEPGLSLDHRLGGGWSWGMSAAATFAERAYQDYFYGVDPAYATATRPAYEADGGYGGSHLTWRLSRRSGVSSASLFVRAELLDDASFADSPLVSTPVGWTIGFNLSRRFGASTHLVNADEP